MKNRGFFFLFGTGLIVLVAISACKGQAPQNGPGQPATEAVSKASIPIDDYVVEIFEDKNGWLWFGTLLKGVARYDGQSLVYFSTKDGLCGNGVTSMVEDKDGNIWLGTQDGLSKYNGVTFTNFTKKDGLCDDRVSNLLLDKDGVLWIGTWGGICRYNGSTFSSFQVPKPTVDLLPYQTTVDWVTEIMQDRDGNIWFGRDRYGACRYDGHVFAHFTKKEGLPSNNVQVIQEDQQGNIWFGCRVAQRDNPDPKGRSGDGGLARYDGTSMVQFPGIEGLSKNETYALHLDRAGNMWIGANGLGVYRYDPAAVPTASNPFRLFKGTNRMDLTPVLGIQSILEDKKGRLWFGLSGGLFRLKDDAIVHVGTEGPWD